MKYKLFCGDIFYPRGGQKDFDGFFDAIEDARKYVENKFKDDVCIWAHIVFEEKIILEGSKDVYENPAIWEWKRVNIDDIC